MSTQLQKITISHIRRFAQNVEIDVSEGATIILAPNGTGKTSIFEAIEFALTGSIKRLDYPPTPIIRESYESAMIRLDFTLEQYCQVVFKKGQEPVRDTEHNGLFGSKSSDDISYLLRLTHLLNQSSREWLVQSKSEEAAGQLDKLSIGKDAVQAFSEIASTKRGASALQDKIQRSVKEAQDRQEHWQNLISRRLDHQLGSVGTILPKAEIVKRISSIANKVGVSFNLGDDTILHVKGFQKEVIINLQTQIDHTNQWHTTISAISNQIPAYEQIEEEISKVEDSIKKRISDKQQHSANTLANRHRIDILEQNRKELVSRLDILEIRSRSYKESQENSELLQKSKEILDHLRSQLIKVKSDLDAAKSDLDNTYELVEQNRILELRLELLQIDKKHFNNILYEVTKWKELEAKLGDLRNIDLSQLDLEILSVMYQLDSLTNEYQEELNISNEKTVRINNIVESTNAIKQAIRLISIHLDQKVCDCPVCGQNFSIGELQVKIERSLQSIGNEGEPLADDLKKSQDKVNVIERKLEETRTFKGELIRKRNVLLEEIDTIQLQINNITSVDFFIEKSLLEAQISIQEFQKEILESEADLSTLFNKNRDAPSPDYIAHNEKTFKEVELAYNNIIEKISEAEIGIVHLSERQIRFDHLIPNEESLEQVTKQIDNLSVEIQLVNAQIDNEEFALSTETNLINTINSDIVNGERLLSNLSIRREEILNIWKKRNLDGVPSRSTFDLKINELEVEINRSKDEKIHLEQLNSDIAKWEILEEHFNVNKEIKELIGDVPEDLYSSNLLDSLNSVQAELNETTSRVSALITFSTHLKTEIDDIHRKLEAVNPSWVRILKRLVVDPRFARTSLRSFDHYRKSFAEVNVPLDGNQVLVSHVASEAQITDVQLSFLLAMAQKYQWSPWRALLLDDPTQHHDLVHASSVFDVLRDYISDYGFQVVLATHDTVQAKFFIRKLENDGIPCKLYTLNATEHGVEAVLG